MALTEGHNRKKHIHNISIDVTRRQGQVGHANNYMYTIERALMHYTIMFIYRY